jgi:hypothetical protein
MSIDDELTSTIIASRKKSDDGSLVIYNLTKGIDFSNPKSVANSLAKVFFEKDAVNWFKVDRDNIEFNPTYKVRILLAAEHNDLLGKTVDDFLEDFKKEEINKRFVRQIDDISTNEEKIRTSVGLGALGALLNKPFARRDDKTEVEDLMFTEILEALEIRTPDNSDLINWEKLPI